VRIEDDCVVRPNGLEAMSQVPRTVEEIEAWMGQGKDIDQLETVGRYYEKNKINVKILLKIHIKKLLTKGALFKY